MLLTCYKYVLWFCGDSHFSVTCILRCSKSVFGVGEKQFYCDMESEMLLGIYWLCEEQFLGCGMNSEMI